MAQNDKFATPPSAVAICSMAFRLPGGVQTDDAFWDVLSNGKDARSRIPEHRFNIGGFGRDLGNTKGLRTTHGHFLQNEIRSLDASFFTANAAEVQTMDPQLRQLLEVTRECLENAGETEYRGQQIGCYVGTFGDEWMFTQAMDIENVSSHGASGLFDFAMANRISFEFDFKGPSMALKTSCSSSFVALHEACRALQSGDCNAAVVAGANLITGPHVYSIVNAAGALSPDGSCKTFDAMADGYGRGEAINAVFLKRVDDAIRDGNPIRAIIRNTGINSDGRKRALRAPDGRSIEALCRRVYHGAGLDPRHTPFVECHGTGTLAGDIIETSAIGKAFHQDQLFIGSVKPNMGHSEGASGLTSLIKAVLSLERRTIPPNIKYHNPNPRIPFEKLGLRVPTEAIPWPEEREERISINSFGIGGANAHVIVDAYRESHQNSVREIAMADTDTNLLLFSANSQTALEKVQDQMLQYSTSNIRDLHNVAYTLACRRELLSTRSFGLVSNGKLLHLSRPKKVPESRPEIAMVFTGQGAQWPMMGAQLIRSNPAFQQDMGELDSLLQQCHSPPNWSIEVELLKPAAKSLVKEPEKSQPLCAAIQIGLVNIFRRAGVEPNIVIGHSSGEIAAAYASGVLTMKEAILTAYFRGGVLKERTKNGAMAVVGLGADAVSEFLTDGVVIAAENSPGSTTISGDLDELDDILDAIEEKLPGVMTRNLKIGVAYHSHHMKRLSEQYQALLTREIGQNSHSPKCAFYSTVTGKNIDEGLDPSYWAKNMVSKIRFSTAIENILKNHTNTIFIEVGPHTLLSGPIREICKNRNVNSELIPAMLRGKDSVETLLSAFGELFQLGIPIDFSAVVTRGSVLHDLPAYPWDHDTEYLNAGRPNDAAFRKREFPRHGLLGNRVLASPRIQPMWQVRLDHSKLPWLADYKIHDDVVFPLSGFIAMAGEAVRQMCKQSVGYQIKDIKIVTPLVLTKDQSIELITSFIQQTGSHSDEPARYDFTIMSTPVDGDQWERHCHGSITSHCLLEDASLQSSSFHRKVPAERWYEGIRRVGYNYGSNFSILSNIESATTLNRAIGQIHNAHRDQIFALHPTVIDACLQLITVAECRGIASNVDKSYLPHSVAEINVFGADAETMAAEAWLNKGDTAEVSCAANGKSIFQLKGLKKAVYREDLGSYDGFDGSHGARLEWVPDFDFVDPVDMFEPPSIDVSSRRSLEEFALLCIRDSEERVKTLSPKLPHYSSYREWLNMQAYGTTAAQEQTGNGYKPLIKLNTLERQAQIKTRYAHLVLDPQVCFFAEAIHRISQNIEHVFTGRTEVLDLLIRDDLLANLYSTATFGLSKYVNILSHKKPGLRILEVGAGTGGTTKRILEDAVVAGSAPYGVYTFTDVSAGFFAEARDRFSSAPNLDFKVFDITKSAGSQSLASHIGTYDLIIASSVIHATPKLKESLGNIRDLLKPDGSLIMCENSPNGLSQGYIFGTLSGWWLGDGDGRRWSPNVDVSRWHDELQASGYSGVDWSMPDVDGPYHQSTVMLSRPAGPRRSTTKHETITIMCKDTTHPIPQRISSYFQSQGVDITTLQFGQATAISGPVVSTVGIEDDGFSVAENLPPLQHFFRNQGDSLALWLLSPSQIKYNNPQAAELLGAIKVVNTELNARNFTLQAQSTEDSLAEMVWKLFNKVIRAEPRGEYAPDQHFAASRGVVFIGRYQPFVLKDVLEKDGAIFNRYSLKSETEESSALAQSAQGLVAEEVEVEAVAVGITREDMRDFPSSTSILQPQTTPVGYEAAGIITRVDPKVSHLAVGDRVVFISPSAPLNGRLRVSETHCTKLPDGLCLEAAATLPISFATAMHCLYDVARIESGQTILVTSAYSAVSRAALQLCHHTGVEVFVTVDNESQVAYVVAELEVPTDHIFVSHDTSFVDQLIGETGGKGVDVVLNSLPGDLRRSSWKCVAEFGIMVDIAAPDSDFSSLGFNPFVKNRTYAGVDMAAMVQQRRQLSSRLLDRVVEFYHQGHIRPLQHRVFPASGSQHALHEVQKDNDISKAVILMGNTGVGVSRLPKVASFSPEASYLLVGGLGGIGRSIATWMVERGARNLVFLSPSASSPKYALFLDELRSMGCTSITVSGSVQKMNDVQQVLSSATGPIKGVIHLAMKSSTSFFLDMTPEIWRAGTEAKTDGTLNLHNALLQANQHPDFFVMTSSTAVVTCNEGQSNYIAANMFMEAFAQYRRSMGLPASVLAVSPVVDVGYVSERAELKRTLKSRLRTFLYEANVLKFIENAILNQKLQENMTSNFSATWRDDSCTIMGLKSTLSMSELLGRRDLRVHQFYSDEASEKAVKLVVKDSVKEFIAAAAKTPKTFLEASSASALACAMETQIASLSMREPLTRGDTIDVSFQKLGLDSMMAIELRQWVRREIGIELSVVDIVGSGTLREVGNTIAKKLYAKASGTVV